MKQHILMKIHFSLFVLRQMLICKESKFDYHGQIFVCFIAIEDKYWLTNMPN